LLHEKYQRLWQDLVVPALAHGTSIKLRALTDNNLTEVLWDLAHLPVDPISVMLELDDSTNVDFPVGGRSIRPAQPLGEIVSMSLISARHQDMDAITVGSLLLNIDTQIDLRLDALTLQIKNDVTGFFRSVSEQDRLKSTHTELHIHQTGLAAAIVGLWLAVMDMGQECPAIVPKFFRGFDDSGIPQFDSGRRW